MRAIDELIRSVAHEARQAEFPIDRPVYERAGKDPLEPILYAGTLAAPLCIVGRDLGKDEVAAGQPLIGAGGRLVRTGIYRALRGQPPSAADRRLEEVLDCVLLTNTVPYKPPDNKAYAPKVRERFRPFLAELLAAHWQGHHVITLGTEAFQWFAPYAECEKFEAFWKSDTRYEASMECVVRLSESETPIEKRIELLPLPHPSPLNARWYKQFPDLLAARLAGCLTGVAPVASTIQQA